MKPQGKVYFSVIIPLYNKEKHIKPTVESIQLQTYNYFEIIIVNDGSTDHSVDIVNNLNIDKLKIINQVNSGVSVARNKGIEVAQHPWIVLLDADDEMKPDYLEGLRKLIQEYPEYKVFATGYEFGFSDGRVETPKFYDVPKKDTYGILQNYYKSTIKGKTVLTGSNVCIHKEVFQNVGFFPEGYKRGEDLDMWFRIALQYEIVFYNTPLVLYQKDIENSATTFIDDVKYTFPYHHWFRAPRNKFNLPYQNRYVINRIIKALYILIQHRKLRYIIRFFMR